VRERAHLLFKKFRAGEAISSRKSGTNEEYSERESLLTEFTQLIDSQKEEAAKHKNRPTDEVEFAQKIWDDAMASLTTTSD
jgi:hypothetical protein